MLAEAASNHNGRTATEALPEGITNSVDVTLVWNQRGFGPSLLAGKRPTAMDGNGFVNSGHDAWCFSECRADGAVVDDVLE